MANEPLRSGREAVARYAWSEAFNSLQDADRAEPLAPEDLERLAEAAWWTGRLAACIDARERAFKAYLDAGNSRRAGYVATELAKDYFSKRERAVAQAWVNRAERLLEQEPECVEKAWLVRIRALIAFEVGHDLEAALPYAVQTLEMATHLGARDLMALGLHDQGRILVAMGRVDEGMAMVDEATVAAVAGELTPWTTAAIYCNTIMACEGLADYRRAREWTDAAKRWCERQAIAGFPGMCRVYRAEIIRLRGAWAEAEQEARRACEELREFNVGYSAAALYEIGEIRLRMGDLAAAEEAFRQAHDLGRDPQPGLAILRLAQGKSEAALTLITSALADETRDRLRRSRLLPALVDIAIVAGDPATAETAAAELEEIARAYKTPALEAGAAQGRGAVSLAAGDTGSARRHLKRSVQRWQEVDAPYEAAKARVLLGEAYRAEGDSENATMALEAARAAFEHLGAVLDAQRSTALLGGEAAVTRTPARGALKTFMLTDMVKSTNLVEALGDEAWQDVLRWHDQTLRTLFARHGGEEIDHTGDGFMVAFEKVQDGLECGVAIQRSLSDHRHTQGFAPQVRIGLHTAAAVRRGRGFAGKGVHTAARIMAQAGPEEILVSQQSLQGVPARFPASEPRALTLKGLADPVPVVSIHWRP